MVEVVVNGERKHVAAGESVTALLRTLNIPCERVAVELNKSIVRKRDWDQTAIADGAQIEIVEFVGGG